jgi:protein kinase X
MNLPRNLDNVAKDLVRNILVMDPNLRFEIDDIKKHKFFKGINWESVTLKKETPVYVPPEINIEKLKVQKN